MSEDNALLDYDHYTHILRERERDRHFYAFRTPQKQWRPHFVRFILDKGLLHGLSTITQHLAIFMFDIFLDNHEIELYRLHLIATACIRISTKLHEHYMILPTTDDLNSDGLFAHEDYLTMELMLMSLFKWDIDKPTAATFCLYFLKYAVSETDFRQNWTRFNTIHHMTNAVKSKAMNLLQNSLFDTSVQYTMLPSKLAAMCVAGARCQCNIKPTWSTELITLTRYTWDDLKDGIFHKLLRIQVPLSNQLRYELSRSAINWSNNSSLGQRKYA